MEKIDFVQATKEMPITTKELAHKISNTPPDVVLEYITGMESLKKQIDQTIAILHATNGVFFQQLLEQMSEEQLFGINRIVDYLNDKNLLNRINELIQASISFSPSHDNHSKANELLEIVKELDNYDFKNVLLTIFGFGWDFNKSTQILLFYLEKNRDETALVNYLSTIDEKDLDRVISTCSHMLKCCEDGLMIDSQTS